MPLFRGKKSKAVDEAELEDFEPYVPVSRRPGGNPVSAQAGDRPRERQGLSANVLSLEQMEGVRIPIESLRKIAPIAHYAENDNKRNVHATGWQHAELVADIGGGQVMTVKGDKALQVKLPAPGAELDSKALSQYDGIFGNNALPFFNSVRNDPKTPRGTAFGFQIAKIVPTDMMPQNILDLYIKFEAEKKASQKPEKAKSIDDFIGKYKDEKSAKPKSPEKFDLKEFIAFAKNDESYKTDKDNQKNNDNILETINLIFGSGKVNLSVTDMPFLQGLFTESLHAKVNKAEVGKVWDEAHAEQIKRSFSGDHFDTKGAFARKKEEQEGGFGGTINLDGDGRNEFEKF